eukprot:SAG31_NODE_505_length_14757_cov_20.172943_5_plen_193_part_00
MQQALVDCGWYNYSLFYRPDGFAFGYFETDTDFDTACAKMDETDVNAKWQAAMSKYTAANSSPIDAAMELEHYFYLGTDRVLENPPAPQQPSSWSPQTFTGGGGTTRAGLKRVRPPKHPLLPSGGQFTPRKSQTCFQLQFEVAELEQYLKDHEAVWPEMQQALVGLCSVAWRSTLLGRPLQPYCHKWVPPSG